QLVEDLGKFMVSGGWVLLASDVETVALEMRDRFKENPRFHLLSEHWLTENPLPVASEREIATLNRGEPVYRTEFQAN
ncbi:tRNA (guanosine(46)-N7)-methyltransferase TrmB, partial [Arthrospira sp. O9.13F]